MKKDHQNFFKALDFLNDDKFINKIKIYLIGKGIKDNKYIIKIIKNKKIGFKIKMFDHFDDIRKVFKFIDFVILPSSYGESFPNILAESMLTGVPCISTDIGESKNILDKYGWIVPPNDPKKLSDAMCQAIEVYDSQKKYLQLSNNCKKQIADNFSEKIMIKKYNKLYLNLEV